MQKIIEKFGLDTQGFTQHNVDFLDLYVGIDNKLFIDYNKILLGNGAIYSAMRTDINVFMSNLFEFLGNDKNADLSILLDGLHETNATYLGLSDGRSKGKCVGSELKEKIFNNLKFLKKSMMQGNYDIDVIHFGIENIGPDRISDIVTSIIKSRLILFTQQQCLKHSILMEKVAVSKVFDSRTGIWEARFVELPVVHGESLILVPKDIVSTYNNISGTFDAFVSYGFHNFFKVSSQYKKIVRGDDGDLAKNLTRVEFDEFNKSKGVNNKAISKKMLSEFKSSDIVKALSEIRKRVSVLSDNEIIEIIENNLKKAN
jgi:hypothetical protein